MQAYVTIAFFASTAFYINPTTGCSAKQRQEKMREHNHHVHNVNNSYGQGTPGDGKIDDNGHHVIKKEHFQDESVVSVGQRPSNGFISPAHLENTRIYRSQVIELKDFPWLVRLLPRNPMSASESCAGSIVSSYFVLTAAHCFDRSIFSYVKYGPKQYTTYMGSTIPILTWFQHPKYLKNFKVLNDIAVVKLKTSIPFSKTAKPIALRETQGLPDEMAAVCGWVKNEGDKEPQDLTQTTLSVMSLEECHERKDAYHRGLPQIPNSLLCTTSSACNGDLGGPLVVGGSQIGVYSSQVSDMYPSNFTCYDAKIPSTFVNIPQFKDFIEKRTEKSVTWVD